ncbi:hypothetical protein C0993_008350 [Termitomyces sp. T159_Od127]|nr:hypothetical protein C0993_008350 [Termitomyces sp. T159_Od127]
MSWIWMRLGDLEHENEYLQDDLRIEWCKSKARADRWQEEVLLLREEMTRVSRFFQTREREWKALAEINISIYRYDDEATAQGRRAYALQQAGMYRAMAVYCEGYWCLVDTFIAQGGGVVIPYHINMNTDDLDNGETDVLY